MNFETILKELSSEVVEQLKTIKMDIKAVAENGEFEVIANMETPDRAGETIIASGWDLTNYKKNSIILFGHDQRDIKNIVGKATSMEIIDVDGVPALKLKGVFAGTENAQVARQLYDEGILKAVSVGFKVLERDGKDSNIIKRAELLETSFVPVGCHQDALDTLDKELVQKGMDMGILKKEAVVEEGSSIKDILKEALQTKLGFVSGQDRKFLYVCDMYEKKFVYNYYSNQDTGSFDKYYSLDYTISDGVATLGETPTEVERKRVWVEKAFTEKRLDSMEGMLKTLISNVSGISEKFMEKKEAKPSKENDEVKKTLEKIAIIANTSFKKHFKS